MILLFALLGCKGEGGGFGGLGSAGSEESPWSPVWEVEGAVQDLAVQDGRLLASSQFGGSVWSWDPASGEAEEIGKRLGTVLGLLPRDDGSLWFTHTDDGMLGDIEALDPPVDTTVLVDTIDGVRLRDPVDAAWDGDVVVLVDLNAPGTFRWSEGGEDRRVLSQGYEAVAVHGGETWLADATGVYRLDGAEAVAVDERPASGLLSDGERLYAAGDGGIFEVGGEMLAEPGSGPAHPGALAALGGVVYVADLGLGSVWALEP